jgi:hypothetical protein
MLQVFNQYYFVNHDGVVKTTFRQFFVIPAQAGDSVDFDLVISMCSGFPPARE